jgi:hypothetical protein
MKITREELQAIENHMSNIPQVAGMYTPVLIAWCRALLDEQDGAFTRGAEAMREACAREASVCANHRGEELDAILSALPIPEEPC